MHALLRPHKDPAAVNVGGEGDAFLLNFPAVGQGEHLEPTAVGEDGAVPMHETVKPPHLPDHVVPWPKVEMIGVGEFNLAADLL